VKKRTGFLEPSLFMNDKKSKEIDHIKKVLLPFFKETNTQKVYLFGSLARGTQTSKNDIDLMIICETNKRFFDRFEDYEKIPNVLNDRSVNMLIYTNADLSKISHRTFIKGILKEGIVLYEC
jgi:predicted nucleotidyltransferase